MNRGVLRSRLSLLALRRGGTSSLPLQAALRTGGGQATEVFHGHIRLMRRSGRYYSVQVSSRAKIAVQSAGMHEVLNVMQKIVWPGRSLQDLLHSLFMTCVLSASGYLDQKDMMESKSSLLRLSGSCSLFPVPAAYSLATSSNSSLASDGLPVDTTAQVERFSFLRRVVSPQHIERFY